MKEIYDKTMTYMDDLRILSDKYSNYRRASKKEISFRSTQNDIELQQAKKQLSGGSLIIIIVTIAFLLI